MIHNSIFQNLIDNIEFYVTFGLLLANLSVAILITIQMKQTKNQFIDLNRPWLHLHIEKIREKMVSGGGYDTTFSIYYPLILENSGNLTAKNIQINTDSSSLAEVIKNKNHFNSFHFAEFYSNYKQTLLDTIVGVSKDGSDIHTITLSYEFSKTKITKNYYLYEKFNADPVLTDIEPQNTK